MVLRWLKEDTDVPIPGRDARISIPPPYRYLPEPIDVVAGHAPELPECWPGHANRGWALVLDGTLIGSTGSSTPSAAGQDVWCSGKHKRHGGNIQVVCGPDGYPEWVSEVEPGSVHDLDFGPLPRSPPRCTRPPSAYSTSRQPGEKTSLRGAI